MPIDLIDTIKPKNGGSFPMVEAEDVVVGKGTADEKRLPEALAEAGKVAAVDTSMPEAPTDDHVPSTQLLKELLAGYLALTGGTVTGAMRINGVLRLGNILIVQNGESKFGNYTDTNNGVAYSFKASKGMFNEMAVDKLTGSMSHKYIPLIYRNTNAGTEVARVDQNGLKELHDGQLQYLADIYAPKAETYTKTEVDTKISNALGDISATLAAI